MKDDPSSVICLPSSETAAACASLLPRQMKTEDGGQTTDRSVVCLLSSVLRSRASSSAG